MENTKGGKKMNAQQLIDSANEPTDFLGLFYPEISKHKLADQNLTKILKELN